MPSTLELLKAKTEAKAEGTEPVAEGAEAMLTQEVTTAQAQPVEVVTDETPADPPEEELPFDLDPASAAEQTAHEPQEEDLAKAKQSDNSPESPALPTVQLTAGQIDGLTAQQLNKVAHNAKFAPEGWPGLSVAEKKELLKKHCAILSKAGLGIDPAYADKPEAEILPPAVSGATKPAPKITHKKPGANADPLQKLSFEIENMGESDVIDAVKRWTGEQSIKWFALGGYLNAMNMNSWFGGYKNLQEFCQPELGISYRTARYLMVAYEGILQAGISAGQVEQMGWTKLSKLFEGEGNLLTSENVDEWVQKALTHNVTDFSSLVKDAKGDDSSSSSTGTSSADTVIKTQSFKLLNDQIDTVKNAIAQAKKDGNTENDSVALEYMALSYLNGGGIVQQQAAAPAAAEDLPINVVLDWMKQVGYQTVLELIDQAFPEVTLQVTELPTP